MQETILVVAHNHDIALLLTTLLRVNGYRAISAASGEEGIRIARQVHPAMAFIDMPLPDMMAREFVRQWQSLTCAPFVMMSTHEDGDVVAQRLGAVEYVAKPFDLLKVLSCLKCLRTPLARAVA